MAVVATSPYVYMHSHILVSVKKPIFQKRKYSNYAISMANQNEYSTIIVDVQLCLYLNYLSFAPFR